MLGGLLGVQNKKSPEVKRGSTMGIRIADSNKRMNESKEHNLPLPMDSLAFKSKSTQRDFRRGTTSFNFKSRDDSTPGSKQGVPSI